MLRGDLLPFLSSFLRFLLVFRPPVRFSAVQQVFSGKSKSQREKSSKSRRKKKTPPSIGCVGGSVMMVVVLSCGCIGAILKISARILLGKSEKSTNTFKPLTPSTAHKQKHQHTLNFLWMYSCACFQSKNASRAVLFSFCFVLSQFPQDFERDRIHRDSKYARNAKQIKRRREFSLLCFDFIRSLHMFS
jgi:hypothetical protein